MAIIACIRVSGIRSGGVIHNSWNYFWQQTEVSLAIFMVSITAFRSLFVYEKSKVSRPKRKSWYSSPRVFFGGAKKESFPNEDCNEWPSIPSATLTGMRTLIRGGHSVSRIDSTVETDDRKSILLQDQDQQIRVTQGLSTEVQEVI